MHTAQHLVKHALTGELAENRTILLVTHHITLCLPHASYLVELSAGKVIRYGTIQELRERHQLQEVVEKEDIADGQDAEDAAAKVEVQENEADFGGESSKANGQSKPVRQPSDGKLIQAEGRAEGRVSLHSYLTYIRAAGVLCSILTIWLLMQIRLINIGVQVILASFPLQRSTYSWLY